jgi:hypothetical protein
MYKMRVKFGLDKGEMAQIVDIDRQVYGSEPFAVAFQWAEHRPEMYTLITRESTKNVDRVLGYGLVMPLRKIALDALKDGKMGEEELELKYLAEKDPEGFYIASLAVNPSIRSKFPIVSGLIIGNTIAPAIKGDRETLAVTVTRAGENMCKLYGMKQVGENNLFKTMEDHKPKVFGNRK